MSLFYGRIFQPFKVKLLNISAIASVAKTNSSRQQTKKQLEKEIARQRLQLSQLSVRMTVLDSQIIAETEGNNSKIRLLNYTFINLVKAVTIALTFNLLSI